MRIVKRGDLLGIDLGQGFAQVVVSGKQPEDLHGQLVRTKLLRRHVLVNFLEDHLLHLFALGDIALHFVLERDFPEVRQQLFHRALVADDRVRELTLVRELVSFRKQLGAGRDGGVIRISADWSKQNKSQQPNRPGRH